MMKRKLLTALTAALLASTADVEAAIVTAPPLRNGFLGQSSDDLTWTTTDSGNPDSAIASGGDDSASAKAEVMKKKKKKKKKKGKAS
ncbi:MAG: hypothetical protein ABL974_20315 [Prosthecobacter sp.]